MNKIWLITQRELFTRIRKRSFIVMTILGPLLFVGYFAITIFFATHQDTEVKHIVVCDSTGIFLGKIPDTKYVRFDYQPVSKFKTLKSTLNQSNRFGILYISPVIAYSSQGAVLYSYREPGAAVVQHINHSLSKELTDQKLLAYKAENLDQILKAIHTSIDIDVIKLADNGNEKKGNSGVSMAVAYIGAILIYMFILMYGVQVMKGVIEEKTNRIVEVIISSVKPFELMMGKVLGIAGAALLQFTVWIVLSGAFIGVVKYIAMPDMVTTTITNPPQDLMGNTPTTAMATPITSTVSPEVLDALSMLNSVNFVVMIGMFLFYFICGYLLYAALFAAVGAAVDNDADTQQFMFPITLPLIVGILVMINAFQNPDSSMAVWFSIIPFTSPIVMMARIPYGVPYEQIALSMGLLIATFVAAIWLAGKIYRTGILMYGKKPSYKEMMKWLKY
jgi:ABC-2 type transport system permease protein